MALPDDWMFQFDRKGNVITVEQWTALSGNNDYKFVRTTRIGDSACVITLWDGYDPYRFDESTPHLIFETTVFRPSTDSRAFRLLPLESNLRWKADDTIDQPRHASEEAALAWHESIVAKLQRETPERSGT